MKFTQFYVAVFGLHPQPRSSPDRSYPIRSGLSKVLIPSSSGGLPGDEITLAEAFWGEEGYATACVGKWHLGWQRE